MYWAGDTGNKNKLIKYLWLNWQDLVMDGS